MATNKDHENGGTPTGFAGLESMVSDVESDLRNVSPDKSITAGESSNSAGNESQAPIQTPVGESRSATPAPPGAGVTPAKVIGAVVVLAALVAIFAGISNSPDTAQPQISTSSTAPVPAPPVETVVRSSEEEMPPVGSGLVLTGQQIRWCVFEKARMETMKEFMASEPEIDAFNSYVSRYNERCSNFRYPKGVLETVESEINQEGRRLQSEGAQRILSLRTTTQEPAVAKQESDQGRIVSEARSGSDNNSAGQARDSVVVAPPSAPSGAASPESVGPKEALSDVEIVRAGFGLFNPPQSGKPAFQASLRVPLQEGQGYGWFIELKTALPKVRWREELVVPSPPITWGIDKSASQSLSEDRKTMTTEREVVPNRGLILHVWGVAAGDPKGPHVVRVYVEGKLVRTFEFETE